MLGSLTLGVAALAAACADDPAAPTHPDTSARGAVPPPSREGRRPLPVAGDDGRTIANPDRGLTRPQESHYRDSRDTAFWRLRDTDWAPARAAGDTLVFRYYYAEKHLDGSPLEDRWLSAVRDDLEAARAAGMRVIPRFAYRPGRDPVRRGSPFHDSPPVEAVLAHVRQLAPVLDEQASALLAVQQGAYGLWGEACYTDHFATDHDERRVSERNWQDRFRVLDAYLEGTARSQVPVLVRYAAIRDRYAQARAGSAHLLRLGLHDDAFGAGDDDLGTFTLHAVEGLAATRRRASVVASTVPFGGECASGHPARTDAAHLSALLEARRPTFLLRTQLPRPWTAHISSLSRRLGYRLNATALRVAAPTDDDRTLRVEVDVRNDGVAPPMRRRPVVLFARQGDHLCTVTLTDADPRSLAPGVTTTWWADLPWPARLPSGRWEVGVHLPDPDDGLRADPRFAIALANHGAFDPVTGRNRLGTVAVAG